MQVFISESILSADETPLPITIIGTENNAPFSFSLPDGTKTGFYVEFWQLWSKINGIPINVVLTSFKGSLAAIKNKGVIHTGLFINENWKSMSVKMKTLNKGAVLGYRISTLMDKSHAAKPSAAQAKPN